MKKLILFGTFFIFTLFAATANQPAYIKEGGLIDGKNIVKLNVSGLAFNEQAASFERILTKNISLSLVVGGSGGLKIPMMGKINSLLGGSESDLENLKKVNVGSLSVTPEVRIYLGKGYGTGVYLAPYYRYQNFNAKEYSYPIQVDGGTEDLEAYGGLTTNSAGLMVGYQWLFGKKKNIVLDWGILGVHGGINKGNIHGKYSGTMDENVRQSVQDAIDNTIDRLPSLIKIEGGQLQPDNTAEILMTSPWAFIRTSVSVGFRF